jgi:hypothetical protein
VISGNTKSGKADRSTTFEIMDEEEFKELEETAMHFHRQKYSSLKIEVDTKWSITKKGAKHDTESLIAIRASSKTTTEKKKKLGVTEMVNQKERLTMLDTKSIRDEYLYVNRLCQNGTTYCAVDPVTGNSLPLLETDLLYFAQRRYSEPSIAITPLPDFMLSRLRQKARNKANSEQQTRPIQAANSIPVMPSITYNLAPPASQLPPWMAHLASISAANFQHFQPDTQSSFSGSILPGPAGSSPPSVDDESSEDFYQFLAEKANPRIAARLIEVGALLKEKYFTAAHTHHLAGSQKQQDRQKLLDLGIKEGIIEKLKSKRIYQLFLNRNSS